MRNPRSDEVIKAVAYVTGFDPMNKNLTRNYVSARRLAVAALREICDMTYVECARALGYREHTSVMHHARGAVDHRLLQAVIDRVSRMVELEEAREARELIEAKLWT